MSRPTADELETRRRIAANAKRFRVSRGLSVDDIAADSGVSRERYLEMEAGTANAEHTIGDLIRVAFALGVDPVELLMP